MSEKLKLTYTDEEILDMLKTYVVAGLKLDEPVKENSFESITYDSDSFWFMRAGGEEESVTIDLEDVLEACNNIDSPDDTFINTDDLLTELNGMVKNGNVTEYIIDFIRQKYSIKCRNLDDVMKFGH
jgi:DNA polymerase III sliding clamp (beta) subunit (PCNA family)